MKSFRTNVANDNRIPIKIKKLFNIDSLNSIPAHFIPDWVPIFGLTDHYMTSALSLTTSIMLSTPPSPKMIIPGR